MLSSRELEFMREAIEDLLPDTCDILQVTETPDGFGGVTQTWGTAVSGTAVPCRLDIINRTSDRESIAGAGIKAFQETILSLPYDAQITVTNRVQHNGTIYNVHSVNTGQSWIAVKRAALERV